MRVKVTKKNGKDRFCCGREELGGKAQIASDMQNVLFHTVPLCRFVAHLKGRIMIMLSEVLPHGHGVVRAEVFMDGKDGDRIAQI